MHHLFPPVRGLAAGCCFRGKAGCAEYRSPPGKGAVNVGGLASGPRGHALPWSPSRAPCHRNCRTLHVKQARADFPGPFEIRSTMHLHSPLEWLSLLRLFVEASFLVTLKSTRDRRLRHFAETVSHLLPRQSRMSHPAGIIAPVLPGVGRFQVPDRYGAMAFWSE